MRLPGDLESPVDAGDRLAGEARGLAAAGSWQCRHGRELPFDGAFEQFHLESVLGERPGPVGGDELRRCAIVRRWAGGPTSGAFDGGQPPRHGADAADRYPGRADPPLRMSMATAAEVSANS